MVRGVARWCERLAGLLSAVALRVAAPFTFPRLIVAALAMAAVNVASLAFGGQNLGGWLLYLPGWAVLASYCAALLAASCFWDPFSARPARARAGRSRYPKETS